MTAKVTIEDVRTRLFRLPLDQPLQDANHGVQTHFEIVTATVIQSDGREGTGYTYTIGKGGHAVQALIDRDIAPFLRAVGRAASTHYTTLCSSTCIMSAGAASHPSRSRRSTSRSGI